MNIEAIIAAELDRALSPAVRTLAQTLAARAPTHVVAVLFYGSALRSGALDTLLDLYVVVDSLAAWHGRWLTAGANRVLPPNVEFVELEAAGVTLRAKVAILAMDQFRARVGPGGADASIWARFAQPVALAYCRDDAARAEIVASVAAAVETAAGWAARLGPASGQPQDYWRALFAHTYAAELRIETAARADDIVDHASERYRLLLPLAWSTAGLAFTRNSDGRLVPQLDRRDRRRALRIWGYRRRWAKLLNLARLAKAAFTTRGGAHYVAWKVERHSGVRLEPTPWQLRHPFLAGMAVLWKLKRRGVVR